MRVSCACFRDAGILFLGDFWHARGDLPVEPLNKAVEEMASWDCPTLFLPGNHDQSVPSPEWSKGACHRVCGVGDIFDERLE
eukprot:gene17763-21160_t